MAKRFRNRALTLATRGILSGVAITMATHGLIQPSIVEAVEQVRPPQGVIGGAVTRVEYPDVQLEHKLVSEIRFALSVDAKVIYEPVALTDYRYTGHFYYDVKGTTRHIQRLNEHLRSNSLYAIGIDHISIDKDASKHLHDVNSYVSINSKVNYRQSNQYSLYSYGKAELDLRTRSVYAPVDVEPIVSPEPVSHAIDSRFDFDIQLESSDNTVLADANVYSIIQSSDIGFKVESQSSYQQSNYLSYNFDSVGGIKTAFNSQISLVTADTAIYTHRSDMPVEIGFTVDSMLEKAPLSIQSYDEAIYLMLINAILDEDDE